MSKNIKDFRSHIKLSQGGCNASVLCDGINRYLYIANMILSSPIKKIETIGMDQLLHTENSIYIVPGHLTEYKMTYDDMIRLFKE